jgi:hypothetical protein
VTRLRDLLRQPLSLQAVGAALVVVLIIAFAIVVFGGGSNPSTPTSSTGGRTASAPGPIIGKPGRRADTLSSRQRAAAARAARRFLIGYLPYLYGQGHASHVADVTPAVRKALHGSRARATPAQATRRPAATAVVVVGQTRGSAIATVTVADGGPATYRLTVTLERRGGRWLVSDLGND